MHGGLPPDRARSRCIERRPESAALLSDERVRRGRPSGTGSRIQFRRAAASLFQSVRSSLSSLSKKFARCAGISAAHRRPETHTLSRAPGQRLPRSQ
jgi:hypothetical protein